jgi:putative membrane protein
MQSKNVAAVVVTAAITLLVVILLGGLLLSGGGMMRGGVMPGGFLYGMPLFYGGLMILVMMALPVLLVVGLVWLFATPGRGPAATPGAGAQTPLDILKMRYARGEITKEQYDEMRQHLAD